MKIITREEALAIYHSGQESVIKVICELSAQVVKLTEKIIVLEERVKILEEQKVKNSHNSSKPPSTDGLQKKRTADVPRANGKQADKNTSIGDTNMVGCISDAKLHDITRH